MIYVGWPLHVGLLELFIRKQSYGQVRRRQVQTMYASDFRYLIDCPYCLYACYRQPYNSYVVTYYICELMYRSQLE